MDDSDEEAELPGGTVLVNTVEDADAPVDGQTMSFTISIAG